MLKEMMTSDQFSLVISQAAAPAFLLGAVASFLSVLVSHMGRIVDRSRAINAIPDGDAKKADLKKQLPELRFRAESDHPLDLLGGRKRDCRLPAHDHCLHGSISWCTA